MLFQIAEHPFDPHSAVVVAQSHLTIRQVGGKAPFFRSYSRPYWHSCITPFHWGVGSYVRSLEHIIFIHLHINKKEEQAKDFFQRRLEFARHF